MSDTSITYLVGAFCGVFALVVFIALVVAPALSSYQRVWERLAVIVLSGYVLAAFIGVGVVLGALIIFEWPRLF